MKQVLQNLKNGETQLVKIPTPAVKPGFLLIQSEVSVVSAGTERMLVDFGKSNYIQRYIKNRSISQKMRSFVEIKMEQQKLRAT